MNTRFFLIILILTSLTDIAIRLAAHFAGIKHTLIERLTGSLILVPVVAALMILKQMLSSTGQSMVWIGGHWIRTPEISIPVIFHITPARILAVAATMIIIALNAFFRSSKSRNDLAFAFSRNLSLISVVLMILSGSLFQFCFFSFLLTAAVLLGFSLTFSTEDEQNTGYAVVYSLVLSDFLLFVSALLISRTFGTTDFQVIFQVLGMRLNESQFSPLNWIVLPFFLGLLIKTTVIPFNSLISWLSTRDTDVVSMILNRMSLPCLFCLIDLQPHLFNTILFKTLIEVIAVAAIALAVMQIRWGREEVPDFMATVGFAQSIMVLLTFFGHSKEAFLFWLITFFSISSLPVNQNSTSRSEGAPGPLTIMDLTIRSGCLPLGTFWVFLPVFMSGISRSEWWFSLVVFMLQIIGLVMLLESARKSTERQLGKTDPPMIDPKFDIRLWPGTIIALVISLFAAFEFLLSVRNPVSPSAFTGLFYSGSHNVFAVGLGYTAILFLVFIVGLRRFRPQDRSMHTANDPSSTMARWASRNFGIDSLLHGLLVTPILVSGKFMWALDRIAFHIFPETSVILITRGCTILGEFDRWLHHMFLNRAMPVCITRCVNLIETVSMDRNIRYLLLVSIFAGLMVVLGCFIWSEGF